ncbi:MAG: DUF547 domain-containing protein [Methanosarcinales archaeon]
MIKELDTIFGARIDSVLSKYVDSDGKVDYLALGRTDYVVEYVEFLKTFDMESLKTKNEKLAFWINAYNMLTIYGVLEEIKKNPDFVKKGNKSMFNKFRFFFRNKYTIAKKKYNLLDIENKILRKKCKEPRVHFALVCGAGSCPLLKNGLYSSTNLDNELDVAAKLFINSPKGTRLDKENNIIYLSWIFKLYSKDFGSDKNSVIQFIARYHSEKEYIENNLNMLKIRYIDYDWGLNIKL